ncbi:MAG: RIP metalloprotease RseP [Paracoccaceae bacterium]|nr:RIP metalloprotease RseP [Paracoccaceae bacterium]MDP5345293.1 RIP metalloprotease RseP [Paracoccaceae bacterium]
MEIFGLIPSFGGFLYTAIAFVVALSIIVAVHEYGHYIVGRWSGIHAEVFSLGFGPRICSWVDKRGTRWQVAALPFGGYVKFLGDSDPASGQDTATLDGLSAAQKRRTMHGAPLWARSATVLAGPMFNFLMAIMLFATLIALRGVPLEAPVVGDVRSLPGFDDALRPGDRILGLDGIDTPDTAGLSLALQALRPDQSTQYRILRDGVEQTIVGPFPLPAVVDAVQPGSAAQQSGMLPGDVVLAVDGQPVAAFEALRDVVGASEGRALLMRIWRDGTELDVTLTPRRMDLPTADGGFETRWLIGVNGGLAFSPQTRMPGVVESLDLGLGQTLVIIRTSLSGLWHMLSGAISSCNLSGPLGIAETSAAAASAGAVSFVWFIATLSTAVGLMNLFPIPVLDGGHLVFHVYEAAFRRPPSPRVLNAMMMVGLVVLVSLMVFALTNDIFCP